VILHADMRGAVELPALPDDAGITGFIAGIAGGQWWGSHQAPPAGLPTVRAWQRESALLHLDWLRERLSC
jgi:hypothetical protein